MKDRSKHLNRPVPSRRVTRPVAPGVKTLTGHDIIQAILKLPVEHQEIIRAAIATLRDREASLEVAFTALLVSSLPPDMIPSLEPDEEGKHHNGFMHVPHAAVEMAKQYTTIMSVQADGSFLVGVVPQGHGPAVAASLRRTIEEGGAEEFVDSMEKPEDDEETLH